MNFWEVHSLLFCVAIFFAPRLTMLLATPWGGLFWWLGWLFLPRVTVAILASYYYLQSNPLLCSFVWLWAILWESGEKRTFRYTLVRTRGGAPAGEEDSKDVIDVEAEVVE